MFSPSHLVFQAARDSALSDVSDDSHNGETQPCPGVSTAVGPKAVPFLVDFQNGRTMSSEIRRISEHQPIS